jgi:hypothetical protein
MNEKSFSTFCRVKTNDGFSTNRFSNDLESGKIFFALSSLGAIAYAGGANTRIDFSFFSLASRRVAS